MDEANEWLDCLRFPVDVDTMEQLVVSHFFEAEEDHVVLAGGHAARLGVAAAEGITPESTTLDNSPVWLASNALSPAAVRAARVLNPTPLLPVVDLAYVVGKAPAERLKARELTRSEKMKMVVATAEWIYDVMRSLVDSRILTRPWYADVSTCE